MKNKILLTFLCGFLVFGLTGCGSSTKSLKEEDVPDDLNKVMSDCLEQNNSSDCTMNWRLQEYLTTYSSYQLLNASQKEFTATPKEPNSLFSYGSSRDALCNYKYALFYNEDSNSYYSIELDCNDDDNVPVFKKATELK